jgi:tropomyosin-1
LPFKLKAIAREQAYEESMRDISERLKEDEERAGNAERAVAKLTKDMDRLEGLLYFIF